MAARILIVEPDTELRESLRLHLSLEGYHCETDPEARHHATSYQRKRFQLAVVNLVALGSNFETWRNRPDAATLPTILVARLDQRREAVAALEQWADDYVMLPIVIAELVARAHALIRRTAVAAGEVSATVRPGRTAILHSGLLIDPARMKAEVDGGTLELSAQEFLLLETLARREGVVFRRVDLLGVLWGDSTFVTPRSVDALVARVRRKMRAVSTSTSWHIANVRGAGYRLERSADCLSRVEGRPR